MKVGHLSLAYYLCMDTVPKKVRCMEVIENEREMGGGVMEAEGSIISAGRVGGDFFLSSRSGGKFIYFPGSYNEILLSTLL